MNEHKNITGIHHVTVISSGAQKTIDFYGGILGLRLVKKTVNFENSGVYHLYFGNENGEPGSILTFFPYEGLTQGRHGSGMVTTVAFSVPFSAMDFWMQRLKKFDIPFKHPQERFEDEVFIYFEDMDGLGLELVFNDKDFRNGYETGSVPKENAIKGFYNIEIWEKGYARMEALLTQQMNHKPVAEKGNRFRFAASDKPGNYVDVLSASHPFKGLKGSGTIHHVAFATPDTETQFDFREKASRQGLNPTYILDRKYFKSVYFEAPGGILFEVATVNPGFAIDESPDKLGEKLMLPLQFESQRKEIENNLIPLQTNSNFK